MKLRHTFITLSACGALALAVGACTHSGDDGIPQSDLDAAEQARMEAEQAAREAEEAREQAEQEKAEAEAEAEAEKKRADELAADDAREQAKMDLAAAKALFNDFNGATLAIRDMIVGEDTLTADVRGTDPVTLPALKKTDDMVESLGGFSGTMYSATEMDGKVTHTAVVYTTKEAPTSKVFAEVYDVNEKRAYNFGGSDPAADMRIESDSFPQEGGTITYGPTQRQFSGSYQGASGTYACSGATCTAEWTQDGINLSEGWTFTPVDGARVQIADPDFLSFGWWIRKNEDGSVDAGPVSYKNGYGANATDTDLTTTPTFDALQGTATYEGHASGKYAIYSGAFSDRSEAGHFTANAKLMADFENGTASGSIKGEIDGFSTASGAKDWSVALQMVDVSTAGAFSGSTQWSIGDSASDQMGTYSGQLYGEGDDTLPLEAGGTFSAPFETGIGQMVGAFAATRETQ